MRIVTVGVAAALVAAGALAAAPAGSTDASLPTLSLDQVLDIAQVETPPAGIGLQVHADFPAEAPLVIGDVAYTALTANVTSDGNVLVQSAVNEGSAGDGDDGIDECTDPAFTPTGQTWQAEDMPIEWRFRRGSIPKDMGLIATQHALRIAHQVWPRARTNCDEGDRIDIRYNYLGLSSKEIGYDGVNNVDFGKIGNGALAVNYTWYVGSRIVEVDLRLNKADYPWTAKPGGDNKYQIANVAAHELGHQIGLDDLSDPHGGLTMFGRIARGEEKKLTLGRGDLKGAGTLSP